VQPLRPDAVSQEAKFDVDELFFSITDKSSKIIAGNDVFYRISGYRKEELIGKYHNIIRHHDMPKIVFKTLWEYIQSDKPIIAYVKNKAMDGSFYWVIAAVFPLEDRYVSIRFKPTSKIFEAVKGLYLRLMMAQSRGGVEESAIVLSQQLRELGYSDYSHFMSDAFLLELQHKKEVAHKVSCFDTQQNHHEPLLDALGSIHLHSIALMRELDTWFDKVEMFTRIKSSFEEKGLILRKLAREIVFLSLNASVSSYKVEHGGEAFGVLASDIRVNAKENDTLINEIDRIVQGLSIALHEVIFTVCCMHLQSEMVNFFVEESGHNLHEVDLSVMVENTTDLIALMLKESQRLSVSQQKLVEEIRQCTHYLDQLEQQMMYLGYIQIYGIIEAASHTQETVNFGVIFTQLKELIRQTSVEVESMQKMGREFNGQNFAFMEDAKHCNVSIHSFHNDIIALKQRES
jgi:aerotaxis receptor